MKNKTYKSLFSSLSKGVMSILGGFVLVSCGIQSGYTETDGIYYDPNVDKIEQKIAWQEPEFPTYENGIIDQSQKVQKQQNQKYNGKNWGNNQSISNSDWGTYVGTQNNYYYDSSTWGYPYHYNNFYSPYYFGYYNSYFGNYFSGWNLGFSWGNPWRYSYYHPYNYGFYNNWGYYPYYNNYYDPYYSPYYNGYYGYSPYYYTPKRYYYPTRNYRRSDADNVYRGQSRSNSNWGNSNRYNNRHYPNNNGFERTSNWENSNQMNSNRSSYPQHNSSWGSGSSSGGFNKTSSWGKHN